MTTLVFPLGRCFDIEVRDHKNAHIVKIPCIIGDFDHGNNHLELHTHDDNAKILFYGYQDCTLEALDVIPSVESISLKWFRVPYVALKLFRKDVSFKGLSEDDLQQLTDSRRRTEKELVKTGCEPSMKQLVVRMKKG